MELRSDNIKTNTIETFKTRMRARVLITPIGIGRFLSDHAQQSLSSIEGNSQGRELHLDQMDMCHWRLKFITLFWSGKTQKDTLLWSYHFFLCCVVLCCVVLCCVVLCCVVLCCVVLCCVVLCCVVLCCVVLCCVVLCCVDILALIFGCHLAEL